MQLDGKIAVITGGASGIGRATALAMARRGAHIVLADINQQRLDETARDITALGQKSNLSDLRRVARRRHRTACQRRPGGHGAGRHSL